ALNDLDAGRKLGLGGIADEDAHEDAARRELLDDMAADTAGGAGNEDGHWGLSIFGGQKTSGNLVIHISANRRYIWTDRLTSGTHGPACPRRLHPGRTPWRVRPRRTGRRPAQSDPVPPGGRTGGRAQPAPVRTRDARPEADRGRPCPVRTGRT